jgi:hypothetical protein
MTRLPIHLLVPAVSDAIQVLGLAPDPKHVMAIYWHLAMQKTPTSKARICDALGVIADHHRRGLPLKPWPPATP